MATKQPPQTTEASTQETQPDNATRGARILKWGLLASPCAVKVSEPPRVGNFGKLDVPLLIDNQRFILPLSQKSPDFERLSFAFGTPDKWMGCTVQVSDGKMLKQVSIVPIANPDGTPARA